MLNQLYFLHHLELEPYHLVAMSTHGRSGVGRWLRGSVAERVLRNSPVPILLANPEGIVKPDDSVRFGTILVPLDGSKRSARVMDRVLPFAVDSESEVVLLHVDTPSQPGVHPVPEVAKRHAQERAERRAGRTKPPARRKRCGRPFGVWSTARWRK